MYINRGIIARDRRRTGRVVEVRRDGVQLRHVRKVGLGTVRGHRFGRHHAVPVFLRFQYRRQIVPIASMADERAAVAFRVRRGRSAHRRRQRGRWRRGALHPHLDVELGRGGQCRPGQMQLVRLPVRVVVGRRQADAVVHVGAVLVRTAAAARADRQRARLDLLVLGLRLARVVRGDERTFAAGRALDRWRDGHDRPGHLEPGHASCSRAHPVTLGSGGGGRGSTVQTDSVCQVGARERDG